MTHSQAFIFVTQVKHGSLVFCYFCHAFSEGGFWTVAHEQRTLVCCSSCYTGRSGHRNSRIKAEEGDLRQGLAPGRSFLLKNLNGDFLSMVSLSTPSSLRRKAEDCSGAGGPGSRSVTSWEQLRVRPWPASSPFGDDARARVIRPSSCPVPGSALLSQTPLPGCSFFCWVYLLCPRPPSESCWKSLSAASVSVECRPSMNTS